MSLWRRILRPVVVCALSPNDSFEETERKWVYLSFFTVSFICFVAYQTLSMLNGSLKYSYLAVIPHGAALLFVYTTKRLPKPFVEGHLVLVALHVGFYNDMRTGGIYDTWAAIMLVMDALLLTQCQGPITTGLRVLTVGYMVLKSWEEVSGIGLYNIVDEGEDRDRGCARLTAREGVGLFLTRTVVILVDFSLTSKFANGMFLERQRMQNVIQAAEEIADALVQFNLDKAAMILEDRCENGPLKDALQSLLHNLHCYRPYLPDSLFVPSAVDTPRSEHHSHPPPRGGTDGVAIVFTDIEGSTKLWEACDTAMKQGLAVHNHIIRETLRDHNGYEVKTLGDSFMAAFASAEDAVLFCVASQQKLLAADWPHNLLNEPLCAHSPEGPWRGLRVRMGVHFGEAEMQVNPVTMRADYFGPTVNIASRVEAISSGGSILITQSVLERLSAEVVSNVSVKGMGGRLLKGVAGQIQVHLVLPKGMEGRESKGSLCVLSLKASSGSRGSRGSEWSDVTHPNISVIESLRMRLQRGSATAGCVRREFLVPTDTSLEVNDYLTAIIGCVERTDGSVVSVCSSTVMVSWNACRPCPSQTSQSMHFVGLLWKLGHLEYDRHTTVGLATGPVLHGNVGSERQRFVTVLGQCVDLAAWLAGCAPDVPTTALVASMPGCTGAPHDTTFKKLVRKVDQMDVGGCVEVFEVHCAGIAARKLDDDEWGWSDACREAIANHDWNTLLEKGDPYTALIAKRGAQGRHLEYRLAHTRIADSIDHDSLTELVVVEDVPKPAARNNCLEPWH